MFLLSHRPTLVSVTCCSTILIQATLPPSGNHLVDPLWLRAQPRTIVGCLKLLIEMLAADVIEPSDSPWASPVCLAKKPDGSYRFCVDYRRVNAVSRKDAYPIPDIQDAFDSLRGATHFATIDLLSGYWHFAPAGAFIILNACPSACPMPLLPFVA